MALANGSYPLTFTAIRADGAEYTYTGNIVIGTDIFVDLGGIANTQQVHGLTSPIKVDLGAINKNQTLHDLVPVVEGVPVVVNLETITNTQTLHTLNVTVQQVEGIVVDLTPTTNTQIQHGLTITVPAGPITVNLESLTLTKTVHPLDTQVVQPTIYVELGSIVNTQNNSALTVEFNENVITFECEFTTLPSDITTEELSIIVVNSLNHLYLPLESRHLVLNRWSKY